MQKVRQTITKVKVGVLIAGMVAAILWFTPSVLADSALVAHWAFDETSGTVAADSSGNAQDGTSSNATISTDVPQTDFTNTRSLSFNGTDAYVSAPAQAALTGNHSRTISLWFKTGNTDTQGLFDSGSIGHNAAQEIYTVAAGDANHSDHPATDPGGIAIVMWDNDIYVPLGINDVADDQWHSLLFTYDSATQQATLYFDGVAEQAYLWNGTWTALVSQPFTLSAALNTTANPVWIGQTRTGYFLNGSLYFDGNIDDVRIYDRAITPEEVGNLAGGSNDPATPPAVTTVTFPNAVDGRFVSLSTPSGTNITCHTGAAVDPGHPDSGYSYPLGLVNFCFTTSTSTNQVMLTFITDLTPGQVVARKYNPDSHEYASVQGASITETTVSGQHALQLTYAITDNSALDSDRATGAISDPIGLAVADTSNVPEAPNTGARRAAPDSLIIFILLPLAALGIIAAVKLRKTI